MTHGLRFVARTALSFGACASLGCSSAGDETGPTELPAGSNSGPSAGGVVVVGAGGSTAVSTGNAAAVTRGAGGVPSMMTPGAGGAPIPGAGGATSPSSGGAPAGGTTSAAGAAGASSGGMSGASFPGSDWTTASNLDANGKLIVPMPGEGFQIKSTVFDLNPGAEVFNCFHAQVPSATPVNVGDWESQMSGGSHHFILYRADGDSTPNGTLAPGGCTVGFGGPTWLYTGELPHKHLSMPAGVVMQLAANQRLIFDMHYINPGVDVIKAGVTLNIDVSHDENPQVAESHVSFNTSIFIPPNGTQTVGGDCTPPAGSKYFIMTTHTHKRGVNAKIQRKLANGMLGDVLVNTDNWDAPTAVEWMLPPYLTFAPGEKFHYSCSFKNDRATTVTVGTSAETNEMCMAVAYFFPAAPGGAPACN